MDPELFNTRNGGLSLAELLDFVENDSDNEANNHPLSSATIFITPPAEHRVETDEDSDLSDQEDAGNVNHLPGSILRQRCEIVFENESSDEESNIPLSVLKKKNSNTNDENKIKEQPKKKKKKHVWSCNSVPVYNVNTDCSPRMPSEKAQSAESPVDFFKLFFDDNIMQKIVGETNRYGLQKNKNLNFTMDELYVMFGSLAFSGYAKYPNKRLFWNSGDDTPHILLNSIRLNRYEQLLRHLHFNDNLNDNNSDGLFKIAPVIEALNTNFREHGGLEEHLSIDESMIPYYGKHHAKQYIKGKPIRFGYKNWAICTSTGYMLAFDIYTGKSDRKKHFGLGGDVVLSLIKKAQIEEGRGYKLFFDNYFTGIDLLDHLSNKNICATGTIRQNRLEGCPFPEQKVWNKEKRGSYKFVAEEKILFVQWKDNKVVTLATNYQDNSIVTTTRWCRESKSRKTLDQPNIISEYNKMMGGVDKMDGLVAAYRSRIRQRKWYWPIFVYLFDVAIVNGWLLMKKLKPKDPNCANLLVFRRYISLTFLQTYGIKPLRSKSFLTTTDVRLDNVGHLIEYSNTERRCKFCSKKSKFICAKCNVGLHPKDCFKLYHTSLNV